MADFVDVLDTNPAAGSGTPAAAGVGVARLSPVPIVTENEQHVLIMLESWKAPTGDMKLIDPDHVFKVLAKDSFSVAPHGVGTTKQLISLPKSWYKDIKSFAELTPVQLKKLVALWKGSSRSISFKFLCHQSVFNFASSFVCSDTGRR